MVTECQVRVALDIPEVVVGAVVETVVVVYGVS